MQPIFFPTPADLRRWFAEHHATAAELPVAYSRGVFSRRSRRPTARKLGWWIVSAKREETRRQRLEKLIAASAAGQRLMD